VLVIPVEEQAMEDEWNSTNEERGHARNSAPDGKERGKAGDKAPKGSTSLFLRHTQGDGSR
jgi:hypothetical protein